MNEKAKAKVDKIRNDLMRFQKEPKSAAFIKFRMHAAEILKDLIETIDEDTSKPKTKAKPKRK